MFLTGNSNYHGNKLIRFSFARISFSTTIFLSLLFSPLTGRIRPDEVAVGAVFLLWGILTALWQKRWNNLLQIDRFTAFIDLALGVIMMMAFHILPVNAAPAAFLLPALEFTSLYGIVGAVFVMTTFAWATMLTGLVSMSLIQQPLWWVSVFLWTAMILFTAALQMLRLRFMHHSPPLVRWQKEPVNKPSEAVERRSEFIVDSVMSQFTPIAPQIAEALELPFQHIGVRTEDYRQEIEKAVNALYCKPDFDKQAFFDCLQLLLEAAQQNWTSLAAFSPREREVLELLLQNLSYKEMSNRLYVSTSTIKTHIYHIFQKLGTSSREEAVCLIRERGWFYINERDSLPTSKR